MKVLKRKGFFLLLAAALVLAIVWGILAANGKPENEKKKKELEKAEMLLADYVYNDVLKKGEFVAGIEDNDHLSALYYVYALRQAGYPCDEYYQSVYDKLAEQLSQTNDFSMLEANGGGVASYAKIIMTVTALGYDAADVGGVNLIEKITGREMVEASDAYLKEVSLLLALTCGAYSFPKGPAYVTEDEIVKAICASVDDAIESSRSWGVDMAAMTIQPLFRYYDKNPEVKAACDRVLDFLGEMQADNGYFGDSYTANNAWSTAQVMMTMGAFGISAVDEESGKNFIKNGKTVIDSVLEYFDLDAGVIDAAIKGYDPAQVLRGISATVRCLNGEKNIFDCTGNERPAR